MDDINHKLRTFDGVAIAAFLMLPALFSTGISQLAGQNSAAGWIALLVALAVMCGLFLITACLMRRYPGKSIVDIASIVTWKPVGFVYGIALCVYFCFFTGIHIRESAEILKLYGLKLTPLWAVAGLLLVACWVMNLLGGRAIVKTAGFFFVVIAVGIAAVLLLGLNRYSTDKLVPILGPGLGETIRNGLYLSSLFSSVMALFLLAPGFRSGKEMAKSGMVALAFSAGAYVLVFVCYVMMFSVPIASEMVSGFMEMGKSSYYNHFFYRFESMMLFFLIFSSVITASVGIYAARSGLARAFRREATGILTAICSVIAGIAAFVPENILEVTQDYLPVIRQYSVFFMAGFPLLLLIISTVKRAFGYEKN